MTIGFLKLSIMSAKRKDLLVWEAGSNQALISAFGHLCKGVSSKVTPGDFHFLISQQSVLWRQKVGRLLKRSQNWEGIRRILLPQLTRSYGVEPQNVTDNKNLSVTV